jgi:hypothetical protein
MATYLQGVTDYIPEIQPFQPNLNLYSQVLQTKQNRYDQNYKAINDIYGKFFYSNLTRENNIERKDEVLKNIEFNLTKVAGLDLSLEQNVTQAKQLFKPFYEDNYLMKDMAWTKNYMNQRGQAEGLKNSKDEKQRAMYWDTGIRDLDYSREEFKEASDDESLGFGNVSYTPYVNVNKRALEIAKQANLQIETVKFSPDGRWVIKNKNGEVLKKPLSQLFEAQLANDPAIQAVYKVQSRVNRKDYARTNAAQFNGDAQAAEMDYLQKNYENLARQTKFRYQKLFDENVVAKNQIAEIERKIANGTALPGAQKDLRQLKQNQEITESVLSRVSNLNEQLDGAGSETATTSNGFRNPYGDIESLRAKVDAGMASSLMYKDLNEAAETFAYMNAKTDIEANPYKVMEIKHANTMSAMAARGEIQERLLNKRIDADNTKAQKELENEYSKKLIQDGVGYLDPEGNFKIYDQYAKSYPKFESKGTATGELNQIEVSRTIMDENYNAINQNAINPMVYTIKQLKADNVIADDDIKDIFGGKSYEDFTKEYNEATPEFKAKMENEFVGISKRWDNWVKENKQVLPKAFSMQDHNDRMTQIDAYSVIQKSHSEYLEKVSDEITNELSKQLTIDNLRTGKQIGTIKNEFINTGYAEVDVFKEATDIKDVISIFANSQDESEFKSKLENYYAGKGLRLHTDLKADAPLSDVSIFGDPGLNPAQMFMVKARSLFANDKAADAKTQNLNAREDLKTIIYDEDWFKTLNSKRDALYKKGKVSASPILPSFGKLDKGSGAFTPQGSAVMVSTKNPTLPGGQSWYSFMREFKTMNIDGVNTEVSFEGGTATGTDYFTDMDTEEKMDKIAAVESLINYVYSKGTEEEMKFEMSYNSIAKNKFGKEVMTIGIDKDVLDKWGSVDPDKAAIFTSDEYNDILRNGVSIIADDGTFTNSLAASSKVSILEQAVDLAGESGVTLTDRVNPDNKITFTKDPNLGDYDYTFTYNLNGVSHTTNKYDNLPLGNTLDQQVENIFSTFNTVNILESKIESGKITTDEEFMEELAKDPILRKSFLPVNQ